jgi:hypothetical protein
MMATLIQTAGIVWMAMGAADERKYLAAKEGTMNIYDFKGAVRSGLLKRKSSAQRSASFLDTVSAPNISLNVGGQRTSNTELWAVALIGIILQLGVIVFAGVGSISSAWGDIFRKDSTKVVPSAFPLMVVGTITLTLGMCLCAYIIDASTIEEAWEMNPNARLAWLQKGWIRLLRLQRLRAWQWLGGKVNDQQFDSFIIYPHATAPEVEMATEAPS